MKSHWECQCGHTAGMHLIDGSCGDGPFPGCACKTFKEKGTAGEVLADILKEISAHPRGL